MDIRKESNDYILKLNGDEGQGAAIRELAW